MTVGDWISFTSGLSLLVMSYLVMMAYRPRKWLVKDGPGYLAAAIFVAFAAAGLNTLYWQVFGHIVVESGQMTVATLRFYGDYVDGIVKGAGAFAGYLHLKALHVSLLNPRERREWWPFEMAFYPRRRLCIRVMRRALERATRRESDE